MTRGKCKEVLQALWRYKDCGYSENEIRESLDMAIKLLEQEPILDKIRAEIKALNPEPTAYDVVDGNPIKDAVWETLADVLKIIDKYKAESEEV
jgi:hypothetical protein